MKYFHKSVVPLNNYFGKSLARHSYFSKYSVAPHLKPRPHHGSHSQEGEQKRYSPLERRF